MSSTSIMPVNGSPVWEIAKRYNTSVAAIQAGNQLEGDVLEGRQLLLIPMK